jgi:predicted transcriptional regulator
MVDFACKEFEIEKIVKCSLNLTKADYKLLLFLMKNQEVFFTTNRLADELKLNLSTIQRSVKKLHSSRLLFRKQKNLEKGGYIFSYKVMSKGEVKRRVLESVEHWCNNIKSRVNRWF